MYHKTLPHAVATLSPNRHPNSLPNDWHPLFLIYKLFSPFPHSFPCTCNFMPNSLEPCSPPFSICFSTRFGHYGRVLFKHLSPRVTNASKLKLNQLAPTRNSDDKSSTFSTKKNVLRCKGPTLSSYYRTPCVASSKPKAHMVKRKKN